MRDSFVINVAQERRRVPLTLKNVYGIVGIGAIALLWAAIIGPLGGIVVVVLVVVIVVVLTAAKRKQAKQKAEDGQPKPPA